MSKKLIQSFPFFRITRKEHVFSSQIRSHVSQVIKFCTMDMHSDKDVKIEGHLLIALKR